ncbi:hypothetical protein ACF0H5_017807 [Mactra antiquata]
MLKSPRKHQGKGAEPKPRGKGQSRSDARIKEKLPFMEDGPFCDVIISVGERKFYSNSGILAYNSPVLMSKLTDNQTNATETGGRKGQKKVQTSSKKNKELDWSHINYKDVYEMLAFIDPRVDTELTDEAATRLLPLSEEFDMKQMRKFCLLTLYDKFSGLQKGKRPGSIHIDTTIRYLKLADLYEREDAGNKPDRSRLRKSLRTLCVNELVANNNPFIGKLVADTDGISEELKRSILEKKLNQVNMVLARERRARVDDKPLRKSMVYWK